MNDIFHCGDSAALVAYLYDECAPGERAAIAAHLERCASCASEIDGLRATRQTLAAWTPPELALGFHITRDDVRETAKVVELKTPWWRAPLPAWAQAAAALVIFGAGLAVGTSRQTPSPSPQAMTAQTAPAAPASAAPASVSRDELAQVEQRIRAELAQMRSTSSAVPVAARRSDDDLLEQVKALIAQSEESQRRDFTLRMVDLAGNIENQRRLDLASVRQQIGLQQGAIGTELRQQREVLGRLVSERTR